MAKTELKTFIKEKGKTIEGDSAEIDGGLQAIFDHLQTIDWDGEFLPGFKENRIEQFVARATVNGVKVVIGLTPADRK